MRTCMSWRSYPMRYLTDRPVLARRAGVSERRWRWCRRNSAAATLVASVCIMLILAIAAAERLRSERNAAVAQQGRAENAEWNLRTLRQGLCAIGVDWDLPPYPPSTESSPAPKVDWKVITQ
jgi:hypothetical protein